MTGATAEGPRDAGDRAAGADRGGRTADRIRAGRLLTIVAPLLAVVLLAAVAYWALAVYDSGPDVTPAAVLELQVAAEGWRTVDPDGPAGEEIAAFFASLEGARALWPPRLLFE